ncbi:uncharacterized protein LOC118423887 [Branchiostoma floridae]|uniref:Uncharacterized protein LOC118423887 n=1 Tax=Branchiostoma floridae TaxID=7739 RepID=A0A9J7LS68_BRAFL|nr:uncharacterized protein LOC118423887 [Branchiostoma floridae]
MAQQQRNETFMPPAVPRPGSAPLRRPPSYQGIHQPWMAEIPGQVRPLSAGANADERSWSWSPSLLGSSGYSSAASLSGESSSPKGASGDTRAKATPAGYNSTYKIRDCPQIDQYKRLLEKIADRLNTDEVDRMKRQCSVPAGTSERMRNNRDFMQWLINTDKINQDNLSNLGILLYYVNRPDLVEKIRSYEEDHGVPIDRRTPTILQSSSSDPEELTDCQTYANDMAERLDQLRERYVDVNTFHIFSVPPYRSRLSIMTSKKTIPFTYRSMRAAMLIYDVMCQPSWNHPLTHLI